MMTCRDLDRLITPFIDDECGAAERAGILAHLQRCDDCRTRVEAESTARHLLHAHASIARTMGVSPAWRPRVFRLGKPSLPVRATVLLAFALVGAGLIGFWPRPATVMAVGVIGDSLCAHDHRFTTRFNVDERECTLGCVKRGAEFVLVTDTGIYRIHDQQMPELPAFADRRVKVEGTVADGRIVVARMTVMADGER
jgi:hypothetical protein